MIAVLAISEASAQLLAVMEHAFEMALWILYVLPFFAWFAFNDWRYARL